VIDVATSIELIRNVDWFSSVGSLDHLGTQMAVKRANSWPEAIRIRGDPHSGDAFIEGANRLTRELSDHFRSEYRKWNAVAASVREAMGPEIIPCIERRVKVQTGAVANADEQWLLVASVKWDLVNLAMEYAYSDLVPMAFYQEVFRVYQAGHFPCNWDQRWPNGTLCVF
jgi:hypothetical protein